MILRRTFSSIVTVCSLICKIQNGPYAVDSYLLYFAAFLSVGKVISRLWSTILTVQLGTLASSECFGRNVSYTDSDFGLSFWTPQGTLWSVGPKVIPLVPLAL